MAFSSHDCTNQKCKGLKYCGLKLKCHSCSKHFYIECLQQMSCINNLLQSLDINQCESDDQQQQYVVDNNNKLKKIFNGTLIKFICGKCDMDAITGDSNVSAPSFATVINNPNVTTNRGGRGTSFRVNANAKSNEQNNENNGTESKNMLNIKENAGIYEMYVSRFERDTKCEDIASIICSAIDGMNDKMFSVQKLGGTRKHHTFASFKVSSVAYNVCCDILKMDWGQHKAEMLKKKDLSMHKSEIKNRNDYRNGDRNNKLKNRNYHRPQFNKRNNDYHNYYRRNYHDDDRIFRDSYKRFDYRDERPYHGRVKYRFGPAQYKRNNYYSSNRAYNQYDNNYDLKFNQKENHRNDMADFLDLLRRSFYKHNYNQRNFR